MWQESLTQKLGLPPAPPLFAGQGGGTPWFAMGRPQLALGPDGEMILPPGLRLYPFQRDGVAWLLTRERALLGDEMGLGKSVQAICALRLLIAKGDVQRALVLCPKSLCFDWFDKFRQWAPDVPRILVMGKRRSRLGAWTCPAPVLVAGYDTWRLDHKYVPPETFDLVILDEIQRIKNPEAALSLAVSRLQAPRRWGLSGTPLENRLSELHAIVSFLAPDVWAQNPPKADPAQATPTDDPADDDPGEAPDEVPGEPPDGDDGDPNGEPETTITMNPLPPMDPERLRQVIAPMILRRSKGEVLDNLLPKRDVEIWLDLLPAQAERYRAVEEMSRAAFGTVKGRTSIFAALNELKQICNRCPETGQSTKLQYLLRRLPDIMRQGEKVLIFSQYPEKSLKPMLPVLLPFGAAVLDGTLSQSSRDDLVRMFQRTEWPRVLLVSLKAGGVGLTLHQANHVIHFDQWWNPAARQQAEDRVHRIGQRRPVTVTHLLTRGTVEERIVRLVNQKRELFRQIMDPMESMSRHFGKHDLASLLGLTEPPKQAPHH